MNTTELLKGTAQRIITFASNTEHGSKTWDEQPSAPEGGYTNHAGFVLMGDIESYADIALINNEQATIRARLAKVTDTGDNERFFIITLDFSADTSSVKEAIKNHSNISEKTLLDILNEEKTVPKLIHVSYEAGRDSNNNPVGIRYEYSTDQILSLSAEEEEELVRALNLTFDSIMKER